MTKTRGNAQKTLYLASYGLKFSQMTLEARDALERSDAIYSTVLHQDSAEEFKRQFPALAGKLRQAGPGSFPQFSRTVLAGFGRHDTAAILTFGNPAFMNGPFFDLEKAAAKIGVRCVFLNAVSSIDALITLFRLNMHLELRVISAEDAGENATLDGKSNTFFVSLSQLNLPGEKRRRDKFLKKVAGAYPPASAVYLVSFCQGGPGTDSVVVGRVAGLPRLLAKATPWHSLFIPAFAWDQQGRKNFNFARKPPWLR